MSKAKEGFLKRAYQEHGKKYDYSKVIMNDYHDQIIITCPIYGDFTRAANKHIFQEKAGCRACMGVTRNGQDNDAIYIWQAQDVYHKGYPVFKVGITSMRIVEKDNKNLRMSQVSRAGGFQAVEIMTRRVENARKLEGMFKKMGQRPLFKGFDGCTEFRAFTPDELNTIVTIIKEESV